MQRSYYNTVLIGFDLLRRRIERSIVLKLHGYHQNPRMRSRKS